MTRSPFFRPGLAIAILALPGCALNSTLTPARCAQVDAAAATVEQLASVLIAEGVEAAKAQKLANAVKAGLMLWDAACAQANAPATTTAP